MSESSDPDDSGADARAPDVGTVEAEADWLLAIQPPLTTSSSARAVRSEGPADTIGETMERNNKSVS